MTLTTSVLGFICLLLADVGLLYMYYICTEYGSIVD